MKTTTLAIGLLFTISIMLPGCLNDVQESEYFDGDIKVKAIEYSSNNTGIFIITINSPGIYEFEWWNHLNPDWGEKTKYGQSSELVTNTPINHTIEIDNRLLRSALKISKDGISEEQRFFW